MWRTNLSVAFVGLIVIGFYTSVAHIIPQLRSEVPAELDLSAGVTAEWSRERGCESDKPFRPERQAERLARPLARRALITLRPALVAMRARKPCRRLRFNLLG